ncbi:heme biosynthesis HemY N-terminal domain-containing protein [Advenella sp. RU8]|uniref:heme biosynthesis HemY N-terminal domain-containing protein n=1 Tax=Advenella sp. RU8 TaxID=3399575 RepID=UPI003AAEE092
MRTGLKLLVLLALAVGFALLIQDSNGYFMLVTGDERRTVSLMTGIFLLLIAFVLVYLLVRFIVALSTSPTTYKQWRVRRHTSKDVDLLEKGWLELIEGRAGLAEKDFTRLFNHSHNPSRQAIASLAAAKAAHMSGHHEERDKLLLMAEKKSSHFPRLAEATATVKAELLLDQGESKQAQALLEALDTANGSNQEHIQKLLLRAYKQTGNNEKLLPLARIMLKKGRLDRFEALRLIEHAAAGTINSAASEEWQYVWKSLNSDEKTMPLVALAASARFDAKGDSKNAGKVLEHALEITKDARLLKAYVQTAGELVHDRLAMAQTWLKNDGNNPQLLTALGYLCLKGQLWGQAERYLTRSLAISAEAGVQSQAQAGLETVVSRDEALTHALLGTLYDRLGRAQDAIKHWRIASAATSALPVLNNDSILPAADTTEDPDGPPDRKKLDNLDERIMSTKISADTDYQADEYFDTAPIPGYEAGKQSRK